MNPILTYQFGEIRRLQDEALASRLADFANTYDDYNNKYYKPFLEANKALNAVYRKAEKDAKKRISLFGFIVCAIVTGPILLILSQLGLLEYWIIRIPTAGFLLIFWGNITKFKTASEQEKLLDAALKKRKAEYDAAEAAKNEAKKKSDDAWNIPEYRVLKGFLENEGKGLSQADIIALYNIVVQGYARTYAEARQVLSQQQHNDEMESIARERQQQELEHQRKMESEAAQQRNAQNQYYREQARTARDIQREVKRAADAQDDQAWVAKQMYDDYKYR